VVKFLRFFGRGESGIFRCLLLSTRPFRQDTNFTFSPKEDLRLVSLTILVLLVVVVCVVKVDKKNKANKKNKEYKTVKAIMLDSKTSPLFP
jgi:hypothetical protein